MGEWICFLTGKKKNTFMRNPTALGIADGMKSFEKNIWKTKINISDFIEN